MTNSVVEQLDLIEELKLRRWAREHFVDSESRDPNWHAIVLDEMKRKEVEISRSPAN